MKRANRVLLLITQADWGGAQSFLLHFAQDLQKQGREVLLAAGCAGSSSQQAGDELLTYAKQANIPTHKLNYMRRDIDPINDLRSIGEIRDLINEWRPDAIHLNSSKMGVLGSIAARHASWKSRVVYRIGGWSFLEPMASWKQWIYRAAERRTAKLKDVIITVHPNDEAMARKLGIIPRKQLVTVANGLDVPSFVCKLKTHHDARQALGIPEHAFVFGTIAGMYSTKGLLPYLDVLANAIREDKNAYGVIIGDGPEESALREKHHMLDVRDRILLPGYLEAPSLYAAFDAFVLPSRKEGMPWTVLEAMAAGVPVIATDVGACRWMLTSGDHGDAGLIVPSQDPVALLDAMHKLRTDRELHAALARAGRIQTAQRFSWEKTFEGNCRALDGR